MDLIKNMIKAQEVEFVKINTEISNLRIFQQSLKEDLTQQERLLLEKNSMLKDQITEIH